MTTAVFDPEYIAGVRVDFAYDTRFAKPANQCLVLATLVDETGVLVEFGPYPDLITAREIVRQYLIPIRLTSVDGARSLVFDSQNIGRSFSISSCRTGATFTYRVDQPNGRYDEKGPFFVQVKRSGKFLFAATLWRDPEMRWSTSARRKIGADDPAVRAFSWFVDAVLMHGDRDALARIEISR